MFLTIEGVYRDGKVELAENPRGVENAKVIVTFVPNPTSSQPQVMTFGMFAGGREATEQDFRVAEWHGSSKEQDDDSISP